MTICFPVRTIISNVKPLCFCYPRNFKPAYGLGPLPHNQSAMLNLHVVTVTICIFHIFLWHERQGELSDKQHESLNLIINGKPKQPLSLCCVLYGFNCKEVTVSIKDVSFFITIFSCRQDDPWPSHGCDRPSQVILAKRKCSSLIANEQKRG